MNKPDLTGKVAIVTGSSRGIGKEIAIELARAGCDVCVAAKTTEPHPTLPGTIFDTRDAILALGRKSIAVKTNLREESEIKNMVERTVAELGRVDILINNAGALWWKNVADTPLKKFDLVMDVNARAAYGCAYYCLPHMKKQGYGHIINMSPPVDMSMLPGKVAYCISKFGMTIVAHGLATEVRKHNIAVNALWPATIVESQASINFGLGTPKNWRKSSIISDATMAILSHEPPSLTGRALLDEEVLEMVGVTDFDPYRCEPGGKLIRIAGRSSVASSFGTGAGGSQKMNPQVK
ncbi:MAG: SDR family oxidoreductase [Deltaproteobacteria bacterium]|nr:SDR family oxidoreductase [Deltaproteobacteria bacterium]